MATAINIANKILDFGKNKGQALGKCKESYLKWLSVHEKVLRSDHRHFAVAAKALLVLKEEKPVILDWRDKKAIREFAQEHLDFDICRQFVFQCSQLRWQEEGKGKASETAHKIKAHLETTSSIQEVITFVESLW